MTVLNNVVDLPEQVTERVISAVRDVSGVDDILAPTSLGRAGTVAKQLGTMLSDDPTTTPPQLLQARPRDPETNPDGPVRIRLCISLTDAADVTSTGHSVEQTVRSAWQGQQPLDGVDIEILAVGW